MEKLTNKNAIDKSKVIWGDFYDYSKFNYINARTNVELRCPKHGWFSQKFHTHLKSGCYKCGVEKRRSQEIFDIFNQVHNHRYDYSISEYTGLRNNINVICPIHGIFSICAGNHKNGSACKKCSVESKKNTLEEFINKSNSIHSHEYDYSLVEYGINNTEKVLIVCKKHGIFKQSPKVHLNGSGCRKCFHDSLSDNQKYNESKWIDAANIYHNYKYIYDKSKYLNNYSKILITCPIHGDFLQKPSTHLKHGCPSCKESKGERKIKDFLDNKKIIYNKEYIFHNCLHKRQLRFDFYLPEKNICIEYNGIQHYESIKFFGGEKRFKDQVVKDNIKKKYCDINNIKLIEIKYNDSIEEKLKIII